MIQRLIRLPQVKAMVGLGRSSIYDRIKRGEFPKPIKVGRVSGWIEAEVQVWISERIPGELTEGCDRSYWFSGEGLKEAFLRTMPAAAEHRICCSRTMFVYTRYDGGHVILKWAQ